MFKHLSVNLLLSTLLVLTACSGDDDDDDNTAGAPAPADRTYAVFNPALSQLPTPNDILFSSQTPADGTMSAGSDPGNPVISGIDVLDGNSVLAPLDITFSGRLNRYQTLDARSFIQQGGAVVPNPDQNVFLLPLTYPGGDPLVQAMADINGDGTPESVEVPTFAEALQYQSAVASQNAQALAALATPTARAEIISLDGGIDNVIRINPIKPLQPRTKYLVILAGDIEDREGKTVYPSIAYQTLRDPEANLNALGQGDSLESLRGAVTGWERLANGYFGFMQSVFDNVGVDATAPTGDDIIVSLTFTTAGTDSVLKSIAAPQSFFGENLTTAYKQDAISKLASGTYNLSADNQGLSTTDAAINTTLNVLLTSPTLPGDQPNSLYNPNVAAAINSGASYASLAQDASVAYLIQRAATEAAISVHNSGSAMAGDKEPFVDIASEALGTVQEFGNAGVMFPNPQPRATDFYRVDAASSINPALAAPARVYQGSISLPTYLPVPDATGASIRTGSWTADPVIGGAIDAGRENPPGTTPPTDLVTYRFPFPQKRADVNVPLLAVTPDETTLGNFGITKPEDGWPVIVFVHGITGDRSTSLPIADAMAFACVNQDLTGPSGAPCFATVAIDQPLHGIEPAGSRVPGLMSVDDPDAMVEANLPGAMMGDITERHYNFTVDQTGGVMPMNYGADIGSSGSLFINLTNFANARDNLRQMVVDLLNVSASLGNMDVDRDGTPDFDTSRVYFIGHSLGGVNGIPFVAINNSDALQTSPFTTQPKVQAAAFLMTGGGLPRLLTNSPNFSPTILTGLANASDQLQFGNSALELYLNVFQGVLASVDAMNFGALLSDSASSTGVLLTEVVGDGTPANPSDTTIPVAADSIWGAQYGPYETTLGNGFMIDNFPAPLAGTEPLIARFNATSSSEAPADDGDPAVLVTRFTEGSHSTPVTAGNTQADPLTSAAVFNEMLAQLTTFFALNGVVTESIVTNSDVVE